MSGSMKAFFAVRVGGLPGEFSAMGLVSARAVAKVTPVFRRARPKRLWQPRIFSQPPSARSVPQKSEGSAGAK